MAVHEHTARSLWHFWLVWQCLRKKEAAASNVWNFSEEYRPRVLECSRIIQVEEVFVSARWLCVWFGWALSWTRATTCHWGHFLLHQGSCSFKVLPAQVVIQLDLLSSWRGPSWGCASNCSGVTQSPSSNSSWFSFSKKEILRDQPVNTLWKKQVS